MPKTYGQEKWHFSKSKTFKKNPSHYFEELGCVSVSTEFQDDSMKNVGGDRILVRIFFSTYM